MTNAIRTNENFQNTQSLESNYAKACQETLRKMMTPNIVFRKEENTEIIDSREKLESMMNQLR
jgi:hypothetical protein